MINFEPLEEELYKLSLDLLERFNDLGMRASGEWEKSVEVVVDGFSGKILANDYTKYLTNGRAAGGFPNIESMREWVKNKFGYTDEKQINSTAFVISRKIAREGTNYHKQGGTDLVDGVLTEQRINDMKRKVGIALEVQISKEVSRELKNIF